MAVAVFDGNYLVHRVMHVPHLRMLSTKDKKSTGGTFGFCKSLRSTISAWSEITSVVAVFDGRHSERRKSIFPGYKNRAKRDEVDPDGLTYGQKLGMQMRYLNFLLPRLGVKVVKLPKREGDDVIGLLSKKLDDNLKLVVSDDKDMFQLVSPDVHIWRPIAEQRVSIQNFEEYAKCSQKNWMLRKSILGDPSDTIPGIKGVGEKTVDKLFEEVGDIGPYPHEDLFAYAMDNKSKKIRSIGENFEDVLRNYKLIDISQEEISEDELSTALDAVNQKSQFDVLAVRRLFIGLEFFSLVENFAHWVTPFQMLK